MTNTHNISAIAITPSQLPSALAHTLPFSSVIIWGNVGLGKSQIIRESIPEIFPAIAKDIAKDRGVDIPVDTVQIWERRVNDYDLLDFGGLPYNDNGVQRRAVPDIWPNVGGTEPVYGVLFLDEFPQAAREKQTVIQRAFDSGQVGEYVLPGHPKSDPECKLGLVLIILAGNRQRDRANSHGLGTQTGNRLSHFTLEPSVQDWLNWAAENDVDPTVMAFIRQMPEYLHKLDPSQKGTEHPTGSTPRSLEKLSHAVKRCPPPELETAIYSGIVGEEAARSYIAIAHAARAINIEEALTSPETADIPQEVGHQFATASLLIRRATKDNFGHIVTYLSRLSGGDDVGWSSPEIMVFVVEAIKRRINVAETVTYRDWSLKWADIRS
jgi:hypothetical protein